MPLLSLAVRKQPTAGAVVPSVSVSRSHVLHACCLARKTARLLALLSVSLASSAHQHNNVTEKKAPLVHHVLTWIQHFAPPIRVVVRYAMAMFAKRRTVAVQQRKLVVSVLVLLLALSLV